MSYDRGLRAPKLRTGLGANLWGQSDEVDDEACQRRGCGFDYQEGVV